MKDHGALGPVATAQGLPGEPSAVMIENPATWTIDGVGAAEQFAAAGGRVVVSTSGLGEAGLVDGAWRRAAGVRVGASLPDSEVVIEPARHDATRNIAGTVIDLAGSGPDNHTLATTDATEVLLTPVALVRHALVTERRIGAGSIIAVAVPGWQRLGDGHVVSTVIRRLATGTAVGGDLQSLGLGIIGYGQHGGMGWLHGRAAAATEGLHLAAIAELDPARLAEAGERFGHAVLHDTVDGLLSDDGVDIVVIATPPSTHYDLTCRTIAARRHAVVEKPLCFTAAEADTLIASAAAAGVTLTVHQNRRFDTDFLAIAELVASGRLGDVFNIETFVGGFEHPCTLWHSDREVSGGRLYDWGAHLIDQTLQLYGGVAPTTVIATGHKRVWHDVTNQDQVRVRMHFEDGREAEFLDSDILAVRRPKYTIQGTRGTVVGEYVPVVEERVTADDGYQVTEHHHAEGPARLRFAEHHTGWGLQNVQIPGRPTAPFPFHRALADHLQLGDPVPVEAVGVRTVVAILEAATASALDGGRAITLA